MKATPYKALIAVLLLTVIVASSCSKNYYSGGRKGSNCGCPSNPR